MGVLLYYTFTAQVIFKEITENIYHMHFSTYVCLLLVWVVLGVRKVFERIAMRLCSTTYRLYFWYACS